MGFYLAPECVLVPFSSVKDAANTDKDNVVTTLNLPIRLTHPLKTLLVITFLMLFALQGCGGGGGSDDGPQNAAPIFTSGTTVSSVADSITTVTGYTASATDADDDTVTFSLSGGSDRMAFNFDSDSGVLSFQTPPNFEVPADSDGNNVYEVEISATDGTTSVMQSITVTVIDDAEPTGYYINTGSASVSDGGSGTLEINDLQAIINGNRIMMMSVANELLYDGILTITDNDFTAVFTLYTGGKDPVSGIDASGTITQGATITGALTGSGAGSGTFSLNYALTNNEVADIARIDNGQLINGFPVTWGAIVGGSNANYEFIVELTGTFYADVANVQGVFHECQIDFGSSVISSVENTNLYVVSTPLVGCADAAVNMDYIGFATTRNEPGMDETLVFMMTSGDYSFSSDFQ